MCLSTVMTNTSIVLLALLPIVFVLHNLYYLFFNYKIARKIGFPVVVLPVSPDNPVWMLTSGHVLNIVKRVFGDIWLTRYGRLGWEYYNKYRPYLESDAIILVIPGKNWIYLCNAEAATEIFQRRNDFPRPPEMLGSS